MSRFFVLLLALVACSFAANEALADDAEADAVALAVDFETILRRPVTVEFVDTPMSDVADFFATKFDINVQLDPRGFTDAGVESSAPVTISVRRPISFASALHLILDNFNLTFVVQDEVLKITSKEKADEILTTKVYAVGDLLDRTPRRSFKDILIETITGTVQPDSWDDNGGPGSISRVASTLVIAQKQDVHQELKELFEMLRAELPKRTSADNAKTPKPDELTTVVYKLQHAVGQETAAAIVATTDASVWRPDSSAVAVVKMKNVVGNEDRSWEALVVRQTEPVQDRIRELLGELGRLHYDGCMNSGPRGGMGP